MQTLLYINSDPEFFGSTHYYPHLAVIHAPEKTCFLFVGVKVMYDSDLFCGNTCGNEFSLHVIKDIKASVAALVGIAKNRHGALIMIGGF